MDMEPHEHTKVVESYQSKTEEHFDAYEKRDYQDDYLDKTEQVKVDEAEEEDSPIEEVRIVVPNTDDPTLPVYTFRMWSLGVIFTCALAFINQFMWFRKNTIQVSALVVQLLSFPIGKVMERVIPKSRFFNPGPFNMKEHVLIATMANCAFNTAYAIDIFVIQKVFYKQDIGWGGGILLVWTTQLIGFGFAGVLRPYLVYPSVMVFPQNLSQMSLFRSLHLKDNNWTGPSRLRWFFYMFTVMFIYYWLPGLFFPVLSFFSWVCWIAPNNIVLGQLTGTASGLGILGLAFDWSTITGFLLSPLVVPWWAIANIFVGFVFIAWILAPALYYTNVWDAKLFPIVTQALFTSDGSPWNISKVMNPDRSLNVTAYDEYGPLRMSTFFAITYGIGFAGVSSILTHTYLFHGREIWESYKRSRTDATDIHHKLMKAYPEVPHWWYGAIFFIAFGVSFAVLYAWPMQLPWWGMFLAMAICIVFLLPIGIITALTNQTPGLNVITEFIIGFAYPGHPIANVTFKTYGYISMVQCITFVQDLKLGHYAKVPPRAMFWVQVVGTFIGGVVNLGVAQWLLGTVKDVCTKEAYPFTCPSANTFYSASVIWGAIGPQRMFGPGTFYNATLYFFLIGFLLPIPFYFMAKKYPNTWWRWVHIPLIFNATGMMPPAVPINFSSWCLVGFIFMYVLRKYRHEWWRKYNYVTSAAFDCGLAISILVIFGVITGSGWSPNWWGAGGADVNGTPDNCPYGGTNFYGE
ncbi:OPT family small oligopeptide transporter [Gongronella butleri]|nr:OPT family small oligopeptide transporter [Gongronella butleri]